MAVYEFDAKLNDGISGPAKAAATQSKSLASNMTALQKELQRTSDSMRVAMAKGDDKTFWKLAGQSNGLKDAIGKLGTEQGALQHSMGQTSTAMTAQASEAQGLQSEMAEVTGGLSLAVEAALAVAAAFGALVLAGASLAIEASELKAKMTATFDALGEGQISGKDTIAMLDELGDSIGRTRKELAPLAQSFMQMGVTGRDELKSLTTAAVSAEALGGSSDAFISLQKKIQAAADTGQALKIKLQALAGTGVTVNDVASKMGISAQQLGAELKKGTVNAKAFGDALTQSLISKGAGPLARAGMSITNVWAKFTENIGKFFEDVDVGPFLDEVKSLFDIFGQAQPSGQALKSGIGGFFKEVFALATKVVPMVKHFLLDLVIYGLKAYIGLKPIVKWLLDLRNNATVMTLFHSVLRGIAVVAGTLLAVFAAVAVVLGVVTAAVAGVSLGIFSLVAAFIGVTSKITGVIADWLGSVPKMASDFISGLVNGISGGVGQVTDAVKGLATGAKNAFKGALGISSPSKEMMKLGAFAGAGVAEGLDSSVGDVHASAGGLGGAAFAGASSQAGGGSSGGGGMTVNVGGIVISGGSGQGVLELTEEAVSLLFEKVALSQGLG